MLRLTRNKPSRKELNKMKFIGRKDELKKLDKVIHTDEMNFTLIYGACVKIGLNQEKPYK